MTAINEMEVNLFKESYFQKFRYPTEKRTGKKQHQNPMMEITVPDTAINDVIEVFICCVNADKPYTLHPNALLGHNCHDGCYSLDNVPTDKRIVIPNNKLKFSVPYLYIVRTKKEDKLKVLERTKKSWPKYKDAFCQHSDDEEFKDVKDLKTDQVRLRVTVTINNVKFHTVTNRITHHDAGEKVKLNITELTKNVFSADAEEVERTIYVLTEDNNGPDIKPDDFEISVETKNWKSEPKRLSESDIIYKRVIKYVVPVCGDSAISDNDVDGHILLRCLTNGLTCRRKISYTQCALNRKRKRLDECDQQTKWICNGQTRCQANYNYDEINAAPVPVTETGKDMGNLLPNTLGKAFTSCEVNNNVQFMVNTVQGQDTEDLYESENFNGTNHPFTPCQNETVNTPSKTYFANSIGTSFHAHVDSQETETAAFSHATIDQPQESMDYECNSTTQLIPQTEDLNNDSQCISMHQKSDNTSIKGNNSTEKLVEVSPSEDDDENNEKNSQVIDLSLSIDYVDMSSVDLIKYCPELIDKF